MTSSLPSTYKAILVQKAASDSSSGSQEKYRYDAKLTDVPMPDLEDGEILVKIMATAFNHRELWIRRGLYPGITPGVPFGGDGAGVVVKSSQPNDTLLNKRVFLCPVRGWENHPDAPESVFGILGGVGYPPQGTFAQYVAIERDQVIPSPEHLDDIHISAWPIGGVTAWRASMVNAKVEQGQNVLITGIGGGVALLAAQLCIAKGAHVYVTSGNQAKIDKAVQLGVRGGVIYKESDWPAKLGALLKKSDSVLDAVIDSAGGDIMSQVGKILKPGGCVVCYGMTAAPKITFTMREVLKNQRLIGSTMGSHQDLIDATDFIAKHKIVPAVSHTLDGLESAEEGFELIKHGDHFGKIVIKVKHAAETPSRL
ncbi:hypothetical protein HGRIS_012650 [Hohenbuehelia grisea]|uniref:Enoyl reductase (ER) domain-containing protein n=1 Tax=Hohenbuehelia grisea TaxID=104357 RepID=A0ABR3ISZ8_9AGAR